MSGVGPFTFALRTAPTGMTVAADGRLDWSPHVGATEPVVLVASGPGGDTELSFEVEVTCPRRVLGVSCGCDASSGLWVFALVLFARRRTHEGALFFSNSQRPTSALDFARAER
jgi:hypothetical protein